MYSLNILQWAHVHPQISVVMLDLQESASVMKIALSSVTVAMM